MPPRDATTTDAAAWLGRCEAAIGMDATLRTGSPDPEACRLVPLAPSPRVGAVAAGAVPPLAASPRSTAAALPSRQAITVMDPNPDPWPLALAVHTTAAAAAPTTAATMQMMMMPMASFVRTRQGASPSRL
ncbi:glycosyl hydrolase [Trichoderma cornu-damae]|uniref:Glycosyl hydrolase n=1 Tax=Trichoderma cornu-damae TaxID=654480 RepID=A0A9P8TWE5_9HYPO|nr:glycosyl hydrolase [Trichoderma cornu-damae]